MTITTFSLDEIAQDLGCTPRWLTERVRAGQYPARKIAGHWRFTEDDVETIIALCGNDFQGPVDTATWSASKPMASGLTDRSRKRVMGL